jgi:cellulose synthase/poly-beta-1,6-N-acetylglucosamine synthase-like glycosyltransferase
VDDRSTDGTAEAARAAGGDLLALYPGAPDPASPLTTRQQALDLAFRKARGQVILTLDADSAMAPGWAAAMAAPMLEDRADAVAGRIGFAPADDWVARWQTCDAQYYFLVSALLVKAGHSGGVFFGNFGFRRALYEQVGGFQALGFALTEDLAFAQAIQAAGARLVFAGQEARVDVRPCPDFAALVTRTLRISSGRFSALALVLTVWPLSLPALLVLALLTGGVWAWVAVGLRYGLGVALVRLALAGHPDRRVRGFAPFYEPVVFRLSAAVLGRVLRRERVGWGGGQYGR